MVMGRVGVGTRDSRVVSDEMVQCEENPLLIWKGSGQSDMLLDSCHSVPVMDTDTSMSEVNAEEIVYGPQQ